MITGNSSAQTAETSAENDGAFGPTFWFAYAAHFTMTLSTTMFYRSADFVTIIGGTDVDLGWIVGTGVAGGLAIRAIQAVASDAYGPKPLWLMACLATVIACAAHLVVPIGWLWLLYPLRFLWQFGINGFFGSSITYVSGRSPVGRMAEVVGTIGTAGFMGMVVGPLILDQVLGKEFVTHERMNSALIIATLTSGIALFCSVWGTRNDAPWRRRRHPPICAVVRRYHPGLVLFVAAATGFGLSLPTVFLRPYLEERGIFGIAPFFVIYPLVALVTRVTIRRYPERYGVRPMVLIGMACLVAGSISYLAIYEVWHLALPATLLGIAHAVLFPAAIAGGTASYPLPFRGVGVALLLAAFDFGSLIGMPAASKVLELARCLDIPDYPAMFTVTAATFAAIGLAYGWSSRTSGRPPN